MSSAKKRLSVSCGTSLAWYFGVVQVIILPIIQSFDKEVGGNGKLAEHPPARFKNHFFCSTKEMSLSRKGGVKRRNNLAKTDNLRIFTNGIFTVQIKTALCLSYFSYSVPFTFCPLSQRVAKTPLKN
jgi:hypothetical protein